MPQSKALVSLSQVGQNARSSVPCSKPYQQAVTHTLTSCLRSKATSSRSLRSKAFWLTTSLTWGCMVTRLAALAKCSATLVLSDAPVQSTTNTVQFMLWLFFQLLYGCFLTHPCVVCCVWARLLTPNYILCFHTLMDSCMLSSCNALAHFL